ncbi:F-box domain-containing protein [Mycena kentingensis (nom. inval.)]|nr:F-box domain-containing protein [Mycena kentingensis (nom. inval.)]
MRTRALRTRLADVQANIDQHRRALEVLEMEKLGIEHELRQTAAFDIHDLPVELTTQIFMLLLPESLRTSREAEVARPDPDDDDEWSSPREVEYASNGHGRQISAPLLVMKVCRQWREIALATPALWATFMVDISQHLTVSDVCERFEEWVERAQNFPLSVGVCGKTWGGDPEDIHILFEMLARFSPKIRHLELHLAHEDWEELGIYEWHLPQLQSLVAACDSVPSVDGIATRAFYNAPMLRRVKLRSLLPAFQPATIFSNPMTAPTNLIPTHITELTGVQYTIATSLSALLYLPNLIHAHFNGYNPVNFAVQGVQTPLRHEKLQYLKLTDDIGILQYLNLPNLDTLELDIRTKSYSMRLLATVVLGRIRRFVLHMDPNFNISATAYIRYLATTFELVVNHPSAKTLTRILDNYMRDVGFLPVLKQLSVRWSEITVETGELITRCVAAAVDAVGGKRLESLSIAFDHPSDTSKLGDGLLRLRGLKGSGVHACMTIQGEPITL